MTETRKTVKKTALIVLLLIAAVSTFANAHSDDDRPPAGFWTDITTTPLCGQGRVCAAWYEPEAGFHGATCCVDRRLLSLNSFAHCQVRIWGPRDPEGQPQTGSIDPNEGRDRRSRHRR